MDKIIFFVATMMACLSVQAAHKCTDQNGRVTYQDTPCAPSAEQQSIELFKPKREEMRFEDNPYYRPVNGMTWDERMELLKKYIRAGAWVDAISNLEVAVGMPKELAYIIKGRPDDINKTTTSYGVSEQWIYRYRLFKNPIGTYYIYIEENRVKAIQDN